MSAELSLKFQKRKRAIELLNQGLISSTQAAQHLNLSTRQIRRLLGRFKEANLNPLSLLHRSKNPWNRKDKGVKELIVELKKENLARSNQYIAELTEQRLKKKVSPMTVRRILLEKNLYHKEEVERRTFKKFEAKSFGQILQMDTMETCFLEGFRRTKLILVLDDYSRAILGFKWAANDTSWENMAVLRPIIEKHGLPRMIYTDNDSKFRTIRHGSIYFKYHQEEYRTEIHRALNELGILLVNHPPYQAFCKGKVERIFRFIQERFLPESKAQSFEELNQEFRVWVNWYNHHHLNRMTGVQPKKRFKPSCFKPLSGKVDLDWIFSIKKPRKIDKYNSFNLDGIRYFLDSKACLVGEKVTLAVNPTHKIRAYHQDRFIQEFKKKKGRSKPSH